MGKNLKKKKKIRQELMDSKSMAMTGFKKVTIWLKGGTETFRENVTA